MSENLVSVAFICFNQQDFVASSLSSILAQDYPNLEVLVSDDCSTDSTLKEVNQVVERYSGPHQVEVVSLPENQGLIGNINAVMARAKGDWIVMAAGDDISVPHRVSTLMEHVQECSNVYGICSNRQEVDFEGNALENVYQHKEEDELYPGFKNASSWELQFIKDHFMWGAAAAWRKEIFEVFGLLQEDSIAEDHYLTYRAKALGDCLYVGGTALIHYRIGGLSSGDSEMKIRKFREGTYNVARTFIQECEKLHLCNDYILKMKRELSVYRSDLYPESVSLLQRWIDKFWLNYRRLGRRLFVDYKVNKDK